MVTNAAGMTGCPIASGAPLAPPHAGPLELQQQPTQTQARVTTTRRAFGITTTADDVAIGSPRTSATGGPSLLW